MPGPWGKAVERLRLTVGKGVSRKAIAKRAHITPTTYGRIERGGHTQTSKLQRIADVYGVPIETVLISADAGAAIDPSGRSFFARLERAAQLADLMQPPPVNPGVATAERAFEAAEEELSQIAKKQPPKKSPAEGKKIARDPRHRHVK